MNALLRSSWLTLALGINFLLQGGDSDPAWPLPEWSRARPREVAMDESQLVAARDYALTGGGSGCVIRQGKLVFTWGDPQQRCDLKSTTKSFGAAALGLAVFDGKVRLSDRARGHHPMLGRPPDDNGDADWLEEITILHLATHTAGFDKPGGYVLLLFRPGTAWAYSDAGANWLAECLTLAYRRDLDELLFERIFGPLGIQRTDLVWRKNQYRPDLLDGLKRREFGAGISANVDAMARFGLLWLRGGQWNGAQLLPRGFVQEASTTVSGVPGLPVRKPEEYGRAADHYGLLWWNNADGTLQGVPRDTYWAWGLYDSLIVVMPTLDVVVARAGQSWKRTASADHYEVLKPFFRPIVGAASPKSASGKDPSRSLTPGPGNPVIAGVEWAGKETISFPRKWMSTDGQARHLVFSGDGCFSVRKASLILNPTEVLGTNSNRSLDTLSTHGVIQGKRNTPARMKSLRNATAVASLIRNTSIVARPIGVRPVSTASCQPKWSSH